MELNAEGKTCSFCGVAWKPEGDQRLAGGFGAQICRACVARYHELFDDAQAYQERKRAPWVTMDEDELLAHLPHIQSTSRQVEEFLHDWVGLLRDRGVSWQKIGMALGVSRQAAWERFTRVRRTEPREEQHS